MNTLIFCLILFVEFPVYSFAHEYNTAGWSAASKYIQESANTTADPCENFLQYACGNWNSTFGGSGFNSEFDKIQDDIGQKLLSAIDKIDLDKPDTEPFKKSLKIFYQQCKSQSLESIDKFLQTAYHVLQNYFVPTLIERSTDGSDESDELPWESKNASYGKFWKMIGLMHQELGISYLISVTVLPAEIGCQTIPMLHISPEQVYSGMPHILYEKLYSFMKIVSSYHNITLNETEIEETTNSLQVFVKDYLAYHYEMKTMWPASVSKYTTSYNQLLIEFPEIHWNEYFENAIPASIRTEWLKSNPAIVVTNVNYFKNISQFLRNHDIVTTSNYGFMIALQKFISFINETNDGTDFSDKIFQKNACLDAAVKCFGSASFRLLCDELGINLENWRNDIKLMKDMILSSFRFLVTGTTWMDAADRTMLIDRVNKIEFYGYVPKWISSDAIVNEKTPQYKLEASLIANQVLAQKMLVYANFKPLITGSMDEMPPSFHQNAFNRVLGYGSIQYFIGWQVPPFYSYSYPLSVKLGSSGFVLAHELMHSFGTLVRNYAVKGDYAPDPYKLKNSTMQIHNKKSRCLVEYYDQYCARYCALTNLSMCHTGCDIGNRTNEENVADNEAIKIAFSAYKFAAQTIGVEPPLSGDLSDLTHDQIFFLAFSRQFCTDLSGVSSYDRFGSHSANSARIEQSLTNFPQFARAFQCSSNAEYSRKNVCSIYGPSG